MSLPTPEVSIIMPTYNRAEYIMECIQSILEQTFANWELIIVDDGSEDNTEELIAGIEDSRIRFHKAGRIGRVGKIKNIGIEKTRAGLIAFIDPDDYWAADKLEKQVSIMGAYPEAGFSLTGGYNFREKGRPLEYFYKEQQGIRYGNILEPIFRSEIAGFIQSLMMHRECLKTVGGFKEDKPFTDGEFILALATHFKAVILYEPLLFRRLHESNYSGANWENGYMERIIVIQDYAKRGTVPGSTARDALFRLYINFGEKCLAYQQPGKAIGKFLKAWGTRPLSIVPLKKIGKSFLRFFIH